MNQANRENRRTGRDQIYPDDWIWQTHHLGVSKIMIIWTPKIHGKNPWDENHRIWAKSQGTRAAYSQSQSPMMVMTNVSYLFPGSPPCGIEKSRPEKCVTIRKESCIYSRQDHAMKTWKTMKNPVSLAHKNTCSSSMEASWVMGLALSPPSCELGDPRNIYGKAESLKNRQQSQIPILIVV